MKGLEMKDKEVINQKKDFMEIIGVPYDNGDDFVEKLSYEETMLMSNFFNAISHKDRFGEFTKERLEKEREKWRDVYYNQVEGGIASYEKDEALTMAKVYFKDSISKALIGRVPNEIISNDLTIEFGLAGSLFLTSIKDEDGRTIYLPYGASMNYGALMLDAVHDVQNTSSEED